MFTPPVDPSLPRIAVVEDEPDLRASVIDFLHLCRYPAWGAESGSEFFHLLAKNPVDVVVLDIQLPDMDGFSIAQKLDASQQKLGIVIVSARGSIDDRLAGLSSGADVYLVKPVDFRELIANIQSVFRRLHRPASYMHHEDHSFVQKSSHEQGDVTNTKSPAALSAAHQPVNDKNHWSLDLHTWLFYSPEGKSLKLTPKEFLFMQALIDTHEQVVSRKQLAIALNGNNGAAVTNQHAVDVLVARLRKKFLEEMQQFAPVKTVTGIGFSLTVPARLLGTRRP